jgi:hypothetical protein
LPLSGVPTILLTAWAAAECIWHRGGSRDFREVAARGFGAHTSAALTRT